MSTPTVPAPTQAVGARDDGTSSRAPVTRLPGDLQRAATLQIIVKTETPMLPRAAFTLITLASMGGAIFTGTGLGLAGFDLAWRWLALWAMGLAGGLLAWRLAYLRRAETEVEQQYVDRLNTDLLHRAAQVGRVVAAVVVLGAAAPLATSYLDGRIAIKATLIAAALVLAAALAIGIDSRPAALVGAVATAILIAGWGLADAGVSWHGVIRMVHLAAFSLWLGGALWNIFVAMFVGRQHPDVDSVIVGARQLDRFRWVVRFALPTIIITGVTMAWEYIGLPTSWWFGYPGVLIPLKVLTIVALVVIFITCPLFRQCSPVQGVCNVADLGENAHATPGGDHV